MLIISDRCAAASDSAFLRELRAGLLAFRDSVSARGKRPVLIAAALTINSPESRRWIGELGGFDEVAVGRGWMNQTVLDLTWRGTGQGPAAVPQVVVLEREVTVRPGGVAVSQDRAILRLVGTHQILAWLRGGLPL